MQRENLEFKRPTYSSEDKEDNADEVLKVPKVEDDDSDNIFGVDGKPKPGRRISRMFTNIDDYNNDDLPSKGKLRTIIKQQVDITAGFFYSIGCSLIHFALLITLVGFVKWPNQEAARKYDEEFKPVMMQLMKTITVEV